VSVPCLLLRVTGGFTDGFISGIWGRFVRFFKVESKRRHSRSSEQHDHRHEEVGILKKLLEQRMNGRVIYPMVIKGFRLYSGDDKD
jgi:hypothetical protein